MQHRNKAKDGGYVMKKIAIAMLLYTPLGFASTLPANALVHCDNQGKKCIAVATIPYPAHCASSDQNDCKSLVSFVSNDSQQLWEETVIEQPDTHTASLEGLACSQTLDRCMLVGHHFSHDRTYYLVMTTANGGYNWVNQSIGGPRLGICANTAKKRWDELYAVDNDAAGDHWVAVGKCFTGTVKGGTASGYVIVSDDSGQHWHFAEGQSTLEKYTRSLNKVICNKKTNICQTTGEGRDFKPVTLTSDTFGEFWRFEN